MFFMKKEMVCMLISNSCINNTTCCDILKSVFLLAPGYECEAWSSVKYTLGFDFPNVRRSMYSLCTSIV